MSAGKYKGKYRNDSSRYPDWDYRRSAAYFVTICTKNRDCYFGDIIDRKMRFSETGNIANKCWMEISNHFPFVNADVYIIMPNHIHGIIVINNIAVGTLHATSLPNPITKNDEPGNYERMSEISPKSGSLSTIIRSYKSVVTKNAKKINPCFGWQPRFYDRIIRNENEFDRIKTYISENPL